MKETGQRNVIFSFLFSFKVSSQQTFKRLWIIQPVIHVFPPCTFLLLGAAGVLKTSGSQPRGQEPFRRGPQINLTGRKMINGRKRHIPAARSSIYLNLSVPRRRTLWNIWIKQSLKGIFSVLSVEQLTAQSRRSRVQISFEHLGATGLNIREVLQRGKNITGGKEVTLVSSS